MACQVCVQVNTSERRRCTGITKPTCLAGALDPTFPRPRKRCRSRTDGLITWHPQRGTKSTCQGGPLALIRGCWQAAVGAFALLNKPSGAADEDDEALLHPTVGGTACLLSCYALPVTDGAAGSEGPWGAESPSMYLQPTVRR